MKPIENQTVSAGTGVDVDWDYRELNIVGSTVVYDDNLDDDINYNTDSQRQRVTPLRHTYTQ